MRGFCLLLMLALVVVALAICGPPAIAGQSHHLNLQGIDQSIDIGPVTVAESPATSPALLPVVADPGSCGGLSCEVACQLRNVLPAARPRNIFRQGVRLLIRLPCG